MQVLISGSIGRRLARRLEAKRILLIVTPESEPESAVKSYLAGSLATLSPEEVEDYHHEEDHEHEVGCGCNHEWILIGRKGRFESASRAQNTLKIPKKGIYKLEN